MNDYQEARAVREEATGLAMSVGVGRGVLAARGERDSALDEAADRLTQVIVRAAEQEQKAMTAAMEYLDPKEFAKQRRLRLARDRMARLREKGGER